MPAHAVAAAMREFDIVLTHSAAHDPWKNVIERRLIWRAANSSIGPNAHWGIADVAKTALFFKHTESHPL